MTLDELFFVELAAAVPVTTRGEVQSHMRQQDFCRNCGKTTLHELDPDPVNHILHLLLTLFCCGFWLPIWILHALTAPKRYLRCLTCGQILGGPTPVDKEAAARQRAAYAAQRKVAIEQVANATGKAAAGAAQTTGNMLLAGFSAVRTGFSAVLSVALSALQQVDRVIWSMAGDDVFMVWFVRCLLAIAMLFVGGLVIYGLSHVIFTAK